MKNLQNLKDVKALNKKEQQAINGGGSNLACGYGSIALCQNNCSWECEQIFCSNSGPFSTWETGYECVKGGGNHF